MDLYNLIIKEKQEFLTELQQEELYSLLTLDNRGTAKIKKENELLKKVIKLPLNKIKPIKLYEGLNFVGGICRYHASMHYDNEMNIIRKELIKNI